jgi:hypothetical protein
MAREQLIEDEEWRRHAAGCQDCREMLAVAEWMTKLVESTAISPALPAAGFLLFKAQIQKRLMAATRIMLPIYAMTIVSGILLIAAVVRLVREKTRVASIMIDAIGMLSSSLGVIALAVAVVAVVYIITVRMENRAKTSGRHQKNI